MPLSIGLGFEAVILSLIPPAPIPALKHAQLSIISDAIRVSHLNAYPYMSDTTRSTPNYTVWNIVFNPFLSENYASTNYFGAIVYSPIFFDTYNDGWKQEVRTALNAVAQRVDWKAGRSAGLHVHVGRGKEDRFTFPQSKNLARLVCRFESALDTLHPIKDNKELMSNRYNELLKILTIEEVYDTIERVTDVNELVQVMDFLQGDAAVHDGYHDFKVNFTTLRMNDTVEFRQHEGTVSGDTAIHWAEFVLRFVQFAIDATDDVIKAKGDTLMDLEAYVRLP